MMNRNSAIVFALFQSLNGISQIVFCPPGAEWNSLDWYNNGGTNHNVKINRSYKYAYDQLEGTDTIKILTGGVNLKQKGDTIFFRNITSTKWQILYNFAAQPGESWTHTYYCRFPPVTTTLMVTNVSTVTINGHNLRKLHLYCFVEGLIAPKLEITERIGCCGLDLPYIWPVCYGPDPHPPSYLSLFLCYKDSTLGEVSFSNYPCDHSDALDIDELHASDRLFSVYPIPAQDKFKIHYGGSDGKNLKYVLFNIFGKEITNGQLQPGAEFEIDCRDLSNGIYFITLLQRQRTIARQKLVVAR